MIFSELEEVYADFLRDAIACVDEVAESTPDQVKELDETILDDSMSRSLHPLHHLAQSVCISRLVDIHRQMRIIRAKYFLVTGRKECAIAEVQYFS